MTIYHLNKKKSTIRWNVKKNGSATKGHLEFEQGQFVYEMGKLLEGRATIDLRTLKPEDRDDSEKQKSATGLLSDSRFDIEHYPLANYQFDNVHQGASGREIRGMLQLRDKVYHLTIPVALSEEDDAIRAVGSFDIQRVNPELFAVLTGADSTSELTPQSIDVQVDILAESRDS
jgi:polyisoprenoid-binding protein YceI